MTGRRSFGPVLLLGLASGALTAVAGTKAWAEVDGDQQVASLGGVDPGEMPLAGALALVVLACWGVLLVTRGLVRRLVALLAVVAAAGTVATVVVGWSQTADRLRDDVVLLEGTPEVGHTVWWFAALVGSVVSIGAAALAVRLVPSWPEMGRRYDAPGAAAVPERPEAAPEEQSSLELWKALDEGHDPTERPTP